jgi:integrase
MDSAQLRTGQPLRAAFTYQQGLMIALLAVRPLRISNFTALELGRTLLPDGGGYSIVFNPNELKVAQNGDLNEPFPKELLPYLGQFLSIYRPRLLRQGTPQQSNPLPSRLWIDRFGAPMGEAALRTNIKTVTKRAFGTALWPHLFRDCLVTSVAIEHPEMVHIASVMLGHKSFKTMQDHYNQAKMFESAAKYSETMSELRSESIAELQAEAS